MQPQHQATLMQQLPCVSQHHVANLHVSTHRTTPEHQMTRVMQPFQCDLQPEIPKHPLTTHTQAHPKQLQATVTLRQKNNDKPTPAATAAQTRYLSSPAAAILHGKTQGFVLRLPPQNIAHATSCSHYNAVRSINSQTCTYYIYATHRTTPEHQMTRVMQPFQCELQPEIPKHPITTHTQAHPKQLQAAVTLRQKNNDKPTPAAPVAHTTYLSSSPAATLHGKTQGFVLRLPPQNIAHARSCSHYNAVRSINSQTCTYYIYATHRTTPEHQMTRVMQPFQCDLQPEILKHPITTHTHKHTQSSFKPRLHCGKKKRQTDPSRNHRTDEVPFTAGCSHFTRKSTRFRAPASSPKHSPCNIMQPLQCGSQHQLANLHLLYLRDAQNNTRTPDDKSHAAIPMRSASTDSKTPYNYAHTSTPKAASSRGYTAAKKNDKPTPAAPVAQTRYLSSSPAATLHGKTQGFVLWLPPQTIAHARSCSHYNAVRSINSQKPAPIYAQNNTRTPMTRVMQPFQCDLQAQIPKHPITTHTQAHPKQLQAAVTLRQKKTTNRPQPQPPHRPGTFHRRLQPLYTEKHKVSCPGFLPNSLLAFVHHIPSSPPAFLTTRLHHVTTFLPHHFPSSPLPFLTTSRHHHFPSSPLPIVTISLPHHFPSSTLPIVPTSLRHHSPSSPLPVITISLPHHFPSSPFPCLTTSLRHHFPSSPLPFVTTSHRHHFPSSPLPFVTTSLRHHPVIVSTLHQGQFHRFLFSTSLRHHFPSSPPRHCQHPSSRSIPRLLILLLCILMLCIVIRSTFLHHDKSQNSICP